MKSMKPIIIGAILFGVTTGQGAGGNKMKRAKKVTERLKEN